MECRIDDDGGAVVLAIEAGDRPQSLWARVGPVYDGDTVRSEPGVWINYQRHHLNGRLSGPVLLTPAVWQQLVQSVEDRLTGLAAPRPKGWLRKLVDRRTTQQK